jgi:hypothetical protein
MNRRKRQFAGLQERSLQQADDEDQLDLTIYALGSNILEGDSASARLDDPAYLLPVLGEAANLTDRWDVRLLLEDSLALAPPRFAPRAGGRRAPLESDGADEHDLDRERWRSLDPSKEHLLENPLYFYHDPASGVMQSSCHTKPAVQPLGRASPALAGWVPARPHGV